MTNIVSGSVAGKVRDVTCVCSVRMVTQAPVSDNGDHGVWVGGDHWVISWSTPDIATWRKVNKDRNRINAMTEIVTFHHLFNEIRF